MQPVLYLGMHSEELCWFRSCKDWHIEVRVQSLPNFEDLYCDQAAPNYACIGR